MFIVGSGLVNKEAFAEWLNTGRKDSFKKANLTKDDLQKLGVEPGAYFPFKGHIYRAVQARGAITGEGYLLKNYFNAAAREGNVATPFPKDIITTDDTFVKGDLIGGRVFIKAGTGVGQLRQILGNSDAAGASTITVSKRNSSLNKSAASGPDALTTTLDATSDYSVVCEWEVVESAAATDFGVAVGLGAVTDGNYSIVGIAGPHFLLRAVGSTDALTAGGVIVPSATAGTVKGQTAAGITAAEAARILGFSWDAYSGAADLRHCALFGNFAVGGIRDLVTR